jgi:hypothetical protein
MAYRYSFCGNDFKDIRRCRDCGMMVCDNCSKGGKSGLLGKVVRGYVGVSTLGLSELAREGYRKVKQFCPSCEGKDLIRI